METHPGRELEGLPENAPVHAGELTILLVPRESGELVLFRLLLLATLFLVQATFSLILPLFWIPLSFVRHERAVVDSSLFC